MLVPSTNQQKFYANQRNFEKLDEILDTIDRGLGRGSTWVTALNLRFLFLVGKKFQDGGGGIDTSDLHADLGLNKSQTVQRMIGIFSGGPLSRGKGINGDGINFFYLGVAPDDKRKKLLYLTDEGRAFYDDLMVAMNAITSKPNYMDDIRAVERTIRKRPSVMKQMAEGELQKRKALTKIVDDEVKKRGYKVKDAAASIKVSSSASAKGEVGRVGVNTTNHKLEAETGKFEIEMTPALRAWVAKRRKARAALDEYQSTANMPNMSAQQAINRKNKGLLEYIREKDKEAAKTVHHLVPEDVVAGKPTIGSPVFKGNVEDLQIADDKIPKFADMLFGVLETATSPEMRQGILETTQSLMAYREWEKVAAELKVRDAQEAHRQWLIRERKRIADEPDNSQHMMAMAYSMQNASERWEMVADAHAAQTNKRYTLEEFDRQIEKNSPAKLKEKTLDEPSGKTAATGSSGDTEQLRQSIIDEIVPSLRAEIREELREELKQEVTAELVNKLTK